MLQISCSGEFLKNMARLAITYTNKTQFTFQSFQAISDSAEINVIKVNIMPSGESVLGPRGQIQQVVNIECNQEFNDVPSLTVQYM